MGWLSSQSGSYVAWPRARKSGGEIVIYQTHIKGRDVFGANNQNSRFTVVRIFRYVLDHMAVLHLTHKKNK